MISNKKKPSAKMIAKVHSRVHYCREAAIVRLEAGLDRLVRRSGGDNERYDLFLGENCLLDGVIRWCPTCGALLKTGYGDGLMNEAECRAAADRVNLPFESLETSVECIAPIIGLMASGLYLVMDCELFPALRGWNYRGSCLDKMYFDPEAKFTTSMCGDDYDAPLFFMPTQRASLLGPARIEEYMEMLRQEDYCMPRAVALYLNGCATLLLDGHHKAAAAAALGRRVRTLVICPLGQQKALEAALRAEKKLELCHGRWNYEEDCLNDGSAGRMSLRDEALVKIASVPGLQDGSIHDLAEMIEKRTAEPWGEAPEICRAYDQQYPSSRFLMAGTMIPPDRIKAQIRKLMETPWESSIHQINKWRYPDYDRQGDEKAYWWENAPEFPSDEFETVFGCLYAYSILFPDSPMLTEKQREWIERNKKYARHLPPF